MNNEVHHHAVCDPCAHGTSKCEPWSSLENVQDSNGPTCVLQIDHISQHMRSSESALVTKSRTTDPTMAMTKNNKQCRTDTTRFRPCMYNSHKKKNNNRFANYFTNWTTRRKQTIQFHGSIMCASIFQSLLSTTLADTFSVRKAVEGRCLSRLCESMNGTTSTATLFMKNVLQTMCFPIYTGTCKDIHRPVMTKREHFVRDNLEETRC